LSHYGDVLQNVEDDDFSSDDEDVFSEESEEYSNIEGCDDSDSVCSVYDWATAPTETFGLDDCCERMFDFDSDGTQVFDTSDSDCECH